MAFSDSFFNRIEKKTNVGKDTILELAKKLQQNDLKNEGTLREVIQTLSQMTGKSVSKEQEDKIINAEKEGLNSAHINIMNSPEQIVTLDQNGLLCRTKDETGEYSPEQLRITNSILAYTSTGWKDVSLGLGKHDYYYYNDKDVLTKATGYGLSSRFVTAGYMWGSQMIGGKIFSENYIPNISGTYFDLNNGNFSLAGGKIVYNNTNDTLTFTDVSLTWEDLDADDYITTITKTSFKIN